MFKDKATAIFNLMEHEDLLLNVIEKEINKDLVDIFYKPIDETSLAICALLKDGTYHLIRVVCNEIEK